MRHPVGLYLHPDDELCHSTPSCEAIPTARKLQLQIVEVQARVEERWGREKCCPMQRWKCSGKPVSGLIKEVPLPPLSPRLVTHLFPRCSHGALAARKPREGVDSRAVV
jgi:hypothetical protein